MGVVHAVPNHQNRPGLFGAREQIRNLPRLMLAITVEQHRMTESGFERGGEARMKRRALAKISAVTQDAYAHCECFRSRRIRRPIIHDKNVRNISPRFANERADCLFLVEAGNDRDRCILQIHRRKIAISPPS